MTPAWGTTAGFSDRQQVEIEHLRVDRGRSGVRYSDRHEQTQRHTVCFFIMVQDGRRTGICFALVSGTSSHRATSYDLKPAQRHPLRDHFAHRILCRCAGGSGRYLRQQPRLADFSADPASRQRWKGPPTNAHAPFTRRPSRAPASHLVHGLPPSLGLSTGASVRPNLRQKRGNSPCCINAPNENADTRKLALRWLCGSGSNHALPVHSTSVNVPPRVAPLHRCFRNSPRSWQTCEYPKCQTGWSFALAATSGCGD